MAQDVLDTLFRAHYTPKRMLHFFGVLGGALDGYVQAQLAKLHVFSDLWRQVPPPPAAPPLRAHTREPTHPNCHSSASA